MENLVPYSNQYQHKQFDKWCDHYDKHLQSMYRKLCGVYINNKCNYKDFCKIIYSETEFKYVNGSRMKPLVNSPC